MGRRDVSARVRIRGTRAALAALIVAALVGGAPGAALAVDGSADDAGSGSSAEKRAEPTISAQPEDVEVAAGAEATLKVAAENAVAYQWERLKHDADPALDASWKPVDGEKNTTALTEKLVFAAAGASDAGSYRVQVVGEGASSAVSDAVELSVAETADDAAEGSGTAGAEDGSAGGDESGGETDEQASATDPDGEHAAEGSASATKPSTRAASSEAITITQQPEPPSAAKNTQVRLEARAAGGSGKLAVRWERSSRLSASVDPDDLSGGAPNQWIAIDRATNNTFTFNAGVDPNQGNRWYRAVFTDADGGTATSDHVKLTVLPAPEIPVDGHPVGQTVKLGETATFTAKANEEAGLKVRWQKNPLVLANGEPDADGWTDIDGATGTALEVKHVRAEDDGVFYRAVFTNASSDKATEAAQLRLTERLDTKTDVTVSGESYGPSGTTPQPFSISAPNALVQGQSIVITGERYTHPKGGGSVMSYMLDASYSGDPKTLYTTRSVTDPVTGKATSDKRLHAIVQANADGTWKATIPWPSEKNTQQDAAFFEKEWAPGTQHSVRILSGTLLTGDYQRGISMRFTVVDQATGAGTAPNIETNPEDATATSGENAVFSAEASGFPLPRVQWQKRGAKSTEWTDIEGATRETLTVPKVGSSDNGSRYRAVFTNTTGTATSAEAGLTVKATPIEVAEHPADQTVETGESARFTAAATGEEVKAQWQRSSDDGKTWENIRGATDPVYTIDATVADDAKQTYRALFTNPGDQTGKPTKSAALTLTDRDNVREHCAVSYGPGQHAGKPYCFTGPEKVVAGEDITIQGTGGYLATDSKTGSVLNFFLDGLYSGDPNTIYRKKPVTNPATGKPNNDLRSYAMVQAKGDGTWTVTIPWPKVKEVSPTQDGKGSFTQQQLDQRFAPGTQHAIRMLSGSLIEKPIDVQRGASLLFTVVDDTSDEIPVVEPKYQHETYTSPIPGDEAKAWVPAEVDSGSSFPLSGTGWLTKDRQAGSTIAVRLLKDEDGGAYRHRGTADDPFVASDETVWQVIHVREGGEFSTQIDLSEDVVTGSYARVQLTTGDPDDRSDLADVERTWTSKMLSVDGPVWSAPIEEGCTADAGAASYTLAPGMKVPAARIGGSIRLVGEDWCNKNTGKGSYVAVKINDGAFLHTGSDIARVWNAGKGKETGNCKASICKTNKTIWYVIEADDQGDFDVEIPMPTRKNSSPAFTEGSYTLRLMTATLSADAYYDGKRENSRTMQTPEFTAVCETCNVDKAKPGKPTAAPDPLHITEDLPKSKMHGVKVVQGEKQWTVTVPKGKKGDWVYVNVYAGSTPQFPWNDDWYKLNAKKQVKLPLAGTTMPKGRNKLSVQARTGKGVGWTWVKVKAQDDPGGASPGTSPGTSSPGNPGAGQGGSKRAPGKAASKPKPGTTPKKPVKHYADLTRANAGDLTAVKQHGKLIVTFPKAKGGDWVYLYLYTQGERAVPIDWVQIGSDRTVKLDLASLPRGKNKIAFVSQKKKLVGWVAANGKPALPEEAGSDTASALPSGAAPPAMIGRLLGGGDGTATLVLVGLALLVIAGSAVGVIMLRTPVAGAAGPGAAGPGAAGPGSPPATA